jgi:hypothetical protein
VDAVVRDVNAGFVLNHVFQADSTQRILLMVVEYQTDFGVIGRNWFSATQFHMRNVTIFPIVFEDLIDPTGTDMITFGDTWSGSDTGSTSLMCDMPQNHLFYGNE